MSKGEIRAEQLYSSDGVCRMKYFYFDTSIWLDHYLERGVHGEAALKLILKIIAEDSFVVFSNFVEKELKNVGLSPVAINALLSMVKPEHLRVSVTKVQFEEARHLAKLRAVPLGDVIHAVIARDTGAQLVSRDWDFEKLKDISVVRKPEDFL